MENFLFYEEKNLLENICHKKNLLENNFCKIKIYWKKILYEKKLLENFLVRKWWV